MNRKKWIAILISILLIAICAIAVLLSKAEYTITFYSADNSILFVDRVGRNQAATPPSVPQMPSGLVFCGWDKDFQSVKKDMDIYPICEEIRNVKNAFSLAGAYGKQNETVAVPLVLTGDVCLCGFDITVKYDSDELRLESVFDEDGAILYSTDVPGEIHINYVSLGNTTGEVDLCKLKFTITGETEETPLDLEVVSIYSEKDDHSLEVPEYNIVDAKVYSVK